MKLFYSIVLLSLGICFPVALTAQTNDSTKTASGKSSLFKSLTFDGVIKTKVETSTENGVTRFNVRNSRIGVRGDGKYLSYRIQVELSNEGTFSPLDLYGTLKPSKNFSFLFGQQHVPFENSYVITPSEMMFANRAFVGKYFTPGSRDIGAAAQYRFSLNKFPMEIQGGIFNGGKINDPHWTDNPSFAFRLIAGSMDGFRTSAKLYKYTSPAANMLLCGADIHYSHRNLRVEAEAMSRKTKPEGTDLYLFGTYVQGAYSFDCNIFNMFHLLTPSVRWDAMGYDVKNNGLEVNRLTAGLNFGLSFIPYTSVLRVDYEQYFGRKDFPVFDNRDAHVADNKITVELVVKF